MRRPRVGGCLLLACALSACGGDSRIPTSPTPSISGRWQGTIDSPVDGMGTITLQLTQKGLDVIGSVGLSQTTISDVPGTLKGTLATASLPTTMQFTVTYSFVLSSAGARSEEPST